MEERLFKRKIYAQLLKWKQESGGKTHASLDEFCRVHSSRILWRYLVYNKDFAKDQETIMLPAYLVPFL